jgi:hypothetical protein
MIRHKLKADGFLLILQLIESKSDRRILLGFDKKSEIQLMFEKLLLVIVTVKGINL